MLKQAHAVISYPQQQPTCLPEARKMRQNHLLKYDGVVSMREKASRTSVKTKGNVTIMINDNDQQGVQPQVARRPSQVARPGQPAAPAARPVPQAPRQQVYPAQPAVPPAAPYGYPQPPDAGGIVPASPSVYPASGEPVFMQQQAWWNGSNGSAVASLVIGIISMITWLWPLLGIPLSIAGIVLGHRGRRLPFRRGIATAGLVLSYIALGLAVLTVLAGIIVAHLHIH